MGFENNFNGIYFHHHFYLKTGVSRNGLSLGFSERDTSSVSRDLLAYDFLQEINDKERIHKLAL